MWALSLAGVPHKLSVPRMRAAHAPVLASRAARALTTARAPRRAAAGGSGRPASRAAAPRATAPAARGRSAPFRGRGCTQGAQPARQARQRQTPAHQAAAQRELAWAQPPAAHRGQVELRLCVAHEQLLQRHVAAAWLPHDGWLLLFKLGLWLQVAGLQGRRRQAGSGGGGQLARARWLSLRPHDLHAVSACTRAPTRSLLRGLEASAFQQRLRVRLLPVWKLRNAGVTAPKPARSRRRASCR